MDKIIKLALYISLASTIQLCESLIPISFPGIKIGFANIITIIILYKYSFKDALLVAVLRTIVTSFILGTFLSPSFVLSFTGAAFSTIIMGAILNINFLKQKLSIISISVAGAIAHVLSQFFVVYYIILNHTKIMWLLPIILLSALASGIITGLIAKKIIR